MQRAAEAAVRGGASRSLIERRTRHKRHTNLEALVPEPSLYQCGGQKAARHAQQLWPADLQSSCQSWLAIGSGLLTGNRTQVAANTARACIT